MVQHHQLRHFSLFRGVWLWQIDGAFNSRIKTNGLSIVKSTLCDTCNCNWCFLESFNPGLSYDICENLCSSNFHFLFPCHVYYQYLHCQKKSVFIKIFLKCCVHPISFGCSRFEGIKDKDYDEEGLELKIKLRKTSKLASSIVLVGFAIYFGMTIAPELLSDNQVLNSTSSLENSSLISEWTLRGLFKSTTNAAIWIMFEVISVKLC